MSRQKFSKEFKARVALEAIRGIRTVNGIAAGFGVHPTQVAAWKREALEAFETASKERGPLAASFLERMTKLLG